jgi:hypothetical protein
LLETPFWELDLVREEVASLHLMAQSELGRECLQPLPRVPIPAIAILNLDDPIVVGIPREALKTIRADFVLEIDIGDGWSDVVGVKAFCG